MAATQLSFTDVLTDEYEYFFGTDEPTELWTIEKDVLRDLPSLTARVQAIRATRVKRVVPRAFRVLNRYVWRVSRPSRHVTEEAVVNAFNAMIKEPKLLAVLSQDVDIARELRDDDKPLLRKLLSVPQARRLVFDDYKVARHIGASESLVSIFTARSAALRLTMKGGLRGYIEDRAVLLSTIADSPELSDYLLANDVGDEATRRKQALARRRRLIGLMRPDVASIQIFGRKRPKPAILERDRALLAGHASALREVLENPPSPPDKGPPQSRPQLPARPDIPAALLSRFNIFLLESAFPRHVADGHDMRDLYRRTHEKNVAALCLSGGGVRSATFNLGVLQGLASKKLLNQFHYISTVSGGGYIGSWLSSWIRRHSDGPAGVTADLTVHTPDPLAPEVKPIQHLRSYSSYLAPRGSALSIDTWAIVATYLRNLFLNWTMFLPAMAAFLAIPRAVESFAAAAAETVQNADLLFDSATIVALSLGLFGVITVGAIRPAIDQPAGPPPKDAELRARRQAVWLWLVPLFLGGVAFVTLWAALPRVDERVIAGRTVVVAGTLAWWALVPIFVAGNLLAAALYLVRHVAARELPPPAVRPLRTWWSKSHGNGRGTLLKAVIDAGRGIRFVPFFKALRQLLTNPNYRRRASIELVAAGVAGGMGGLFLNVLFRFLFHPDKLTEIGRLPRLEIYVCTGIPLFLLVFFLTATLHVGLTTRESTEHEREWWSRTAALIFVIGLVYLVIAVATILVPMVLVEFPEMAALSGAAAGVVSWLLSRGNRTPANAKEKEMVGASSWMIGSLKVAAVVCLLLVVALVSLATTTVLSQMQRITAGTVTSGLHVERLDFWRHEAAVARHLNALREVDWRVLAGFGSVMLLIAAIMTRVLNVNTYSMHAMYRNRLVRAYLGASRWTRRPEPFTGFDPQDDIEMWHLRPEVIWPSSFIDPDAFLKKLAEGEREDGSPLFPRFSEAVQNHLRAYVAAPNEALRDDLQTEVIQELNKLMLARDLEYDEEAEPSLELLRDNRRFLDRYLKGVLEPCPEDTARPSDRLPIARRDDDERPVLDSPMLRRRPPLHVINMALNLVGGDNLAWRERKADSFTVSSLHSGNRRLGYRDSAEYGNRISLGTAMAISGAAVSPNMGYNSSPVVTFLMTLFNARLGWWLGNPGTAGQKTYGKSGPGRSLKSIVDEAFGRTNDKSPYVFLSDGGHFDNLGLYEMVLRRCRYIVACDASADRRYAFGDLANAIRKIRIDLGIDIELRSTIYIGPQQNEKYGRYCAIGYIHYERVDKDLNPRYQKQGLLVYIKPVVYDDCPTDVRHYHKENDGFPHESTMDQFFSESQFESYRALGRHIVTQISETLDPKKKELSVYEFVDSANAYVHRQQAPLGDQRVYNVSDLVGWMERSLQ